MVKIEDTNQELKYLGFVRIAAIKILICLSSLYNYVKEKSGPLRSVEGSVTSVLSPVYDKFKDLPYDLLVVLDNKLNEVSIKLQGYASAPAKWVTCFFSQKESQLIQTLKSLTRAGGPTSAASYVVNKTKEYLMEKSVMVWFELEKVKGFHRVAETGAIKAGYWLEKYNQTVVSMRKKDYFGFDYLPLVPIEKIIEAFKNSVEERKESVKQD